MHPEGNPLKGVALVVAATLLFAGGDTLGKHLSMLYAAPLILSARYIINVALVLVTMWPRHRSVVWRTQRTGLVILRGVLLAFATITMLLALRVMPVAETVAIIYITPVLLMLASGPILGERVSPLGWLCAALGFAGVLLIARPGSGLDPWGVALCLLNAVLGSGYHLLTRRPDAPDAGLVLVYATCATLGHLLLTSAYREAPASTLAPVNYMHIAFATALGWLVFHQLPDVLAFTGMALIAVSGLLAAWRASR
jgi:drug/metabolite transporter (DMT)-like permease